MLCTTMSAAGAAAAIIALSPKRSTKPPKQGERQADMMYGILITWLALATPLLSALQ
jgi:hypothetical protein